MLITTTMLSAVGFSFAAPIARWQLKANSAEERSNRTVRRERENIGEQSRSKIFKLQNLKLQEASNHKLQSRVQNKKMGRKKMEQSGTGSNRSRGSRGNGEGTIARQG